MITFEDGLRRTCLFPRFSALESVLRASPNTDIRISEAGGGGTGTRDEGVSVDRVRGEGVLVVASFAWLVGRRFSSVGPMIGHLPFVIMPTK